MTIAERIIRLLKALKDKSLSCRAMCEITKIQENSLRGELTKMFERGLLNRKQAYCQFSKRICWSYWLKGTRTR